MIRFCKCGNALKKYYWKGIDKGYYDTCGNKMCDNIGKLNHKWKGGRTIDKDGYILVLDRNHPNIYKKGISRYRREHIVVMEKFLKRSLKKSEVVHHKNGIKDDNRIENLELFINNGEHLKTEFQGKRFGSDNPNWKGGIYANS